MKLIRGANDCIYFEHHFYSVLQDYVKKFPALRHLCMILKVFLHQRELNEVQLLKTISRSILIIDCL